jgi:hypothetical protein
MFVATADDPGASMRFAGTESWSVSIDQWDESLECGLWFRAAERIEVPVGGLVTGPPDVDPMPEPSLASGEDFGRRVAAVVARRAHHVGGTAGFG